MKQYLDQLGVEYLWGKIKRNFANLSNNGKVPASLLPSYVDDVEEYGSLLSFPTLGEEGKIYVAKDTNLTYRWSGSTYVEISLSIALGETSNTAYPGDKGKLLADDLKAEVDRAKYEEADIRAAITAEKNRAEASEKDNRSLIEKNTNDIVKEINNRVAGDESLSASINAETLARLDADDEEKLARQEADATEKAERQSEDNLIRAKIEQELTRAEDAERVISNNLSNEIDRAKSEESKLAASITTETSRATTSENDLSDRITRLNTRDDQITETLNNITVTGGASVASAVTYNNATSNLVSVNVLGAIDELQRTKIDKTSILLESGTTYDKVMSQKAIRAELNKKFDKVNIVQEIGNSTKDVVSQNVIYDNIKFPVMKFHKGMMEITNELGEDGNATGNVQINVLQEIKYTISSKQFKDIDFNKYYTIAKKSYIFSLPSTQCTLCWNYNNLQFEAYSLRQVYSSYCIPICFIYTYKDNEVVLININLTDNIIGIRLINYKTNYPTYFELNNLDSIHIRDIMPDDIENEDLHHYVDYICKSVKTIYIDEGDYKIGQFFFNNNSVNIKYFTNKHIIGVNRDKCIIRAWDFNNNTSTKLIANNSWHNSVFENLTVYNCGFGNSLPESFYDTTFYITVKNIIFNVTENAQSGYLNYIHNVHCIFDIRDCVVNVDENVRLFTAIYMDLGEKLIVDNCIINGLNKNDRSKQLITLPIHISGTKNAIIKNNTIYGGTEGIITKIDKSKSLEHFTIEHNTVEGTKEEGISFDCFGNNVGLHPTICELSITSAEYIEYTLLESTNKSLKLYCTARNLKGSHPNETWQVYSLIEHKDYLKDFYIFFSNYAGDVFGGTICKCLDVGEDDKGVYVIADISFDPETLELSEDTDPKVGTNDSKRTSNFKRASIVSGVFAMSVKNNIIRNTKGTGLALFCAIYNSVVDGNTFENCAGGCYLFSSIALAVAAFTPCCNNKIINNTIIGGGTTLGETGYGFTFYGYAEGADMLCYNNVFANNYLNTNQLYINNVKNLILTGNILDGNTILRLKNTVETNIFGTKLPVAPLPGQHFFNTTTKKEMMYNGTEWIEVI